MTKRVKVISVDTAIICLSLFSTYLRRLQSYLEV